VSKQKLIAMLGVFLLSMSSGSAVQGNLTNTTLGNVTGVEYGDVVREAGDLPSLEHMDAVYDAFGVPLAIVALLPVFVMVVVGAFLGEWQRRKFWVMTVLTGVTAVLSLILFPVLLTHL
jgi:hypothetical protein